MKSILLTFDLEEFDLPREFNQTISDEKMYSITKNGLDSLTRLLSKYKIKATFFTTANFAKKYPALIRELSEKYEIASHGYSHSETFSFERLKQAKKEKEKIIGKEINGYRAPRFQIQIKELCGLNFKYDSSIHPTWLPGRYFNLFEKRKEYDLEDIIEIPPSTLPLVRLPIFWLAFKNFPLVYSKFFTKLNFVSSNYTMIIMHPWEFSNDITKFEIPFYIKRNPGKLHKKFENYIKFCLNKKYSFSTISDYLKL
ncbi:MAG: polysaccharide deacetylase family protein [Nanoarchaeota archaeon]